MESWFQTMKTKLSQQINQNAQIKKMVSELNLLNKEFAAKKNQINSFLNTEKDKTVKQAQVKYKSVLKQINLTQKQLDKDVKKTVQQIKKSAFQLEKNLESYKEKLWKQKTKVEKKLSTMRKPKRTAKSANTKSATKKASHTTKKTV